MALSRLSDSQKIDLVERYRRGETSAELAVAFGCSPNTVSRTVKAALSPADYQQLKQQRGRGSNASTPSSSPAAAANAGGDTLEASTSTSTEVLAQFKVTGAANSEIQGEVAGVIETSDLFETADLADLIHTTDQIDSQDPLNTEAQISNESQISSEDQISSESQREAEAAVAVLAIDDADDFATDASDDGSDDLDPDLDTDTDDLFVEIPALALEVNHDPVQVHPLVVAALPESLYMLVDKTVELQAKPLKDFTELGQLPPEEQDRQALLLFSNPRQAKRHCGRTQRVIKMPDPAVLERTAPYLLVQGISRLVLEGTLYSLPGS